MTNEEAAKRIKQGDKAAEVTLWQNVLGIIRLYVYRWCRAKAVLCARAGVTLEDLIQEGYFAMLEAVSAYDETKGYMFNTYIKYHLHNAFRGACGVRTSRRVILNEAASLDRQIKDSEDEKGTLYELIPDKHNSIEEAEERLYMEQLRADVRACVEELPEGERMAVNYYFYQGYNYAQMAAVLGCKPAKGRGIVNNAVRSMSRTERGKRLSQYIEHKNLKGL